MERQALRRSGLVSTGQLADAVLYEDGEPLKGVHPQRLAVVRDDGNGRFTFRWHEGFYFAATNNSDPRDNGRTYELEVPQTVLERVTAILPAGLRPQMTLVLLGACLLVLPWAAVTYAPREQRLDWLRRSLPFVCTMGLLLFVAMLFRENIVNVYSLGGKVFHAGVALILLLVFLVFPFWNWRTEQRYQVSRFARGPSLWMAALSILLIQVLSLAGAVEAGARLVPVISTGSLNPGCRFLWNDDVSKYNSLGFDDREPGPKRGPRILVLGDSNTHGYGVTKQQRYSARLEGLLHKSDASLEVFNAGKGGMDTLEEAAALERIGDVIRPDIVVVGYCLNDAEGDLPVVHFTSVDRLFFFTFPSYAYSRLYLSKPIDRWARSIRQHQSDSLGWARVLMGFDRIGGWCRQRNVRAIVIVFPMFESGSQDGRAVMDQVVNAAVNRGLMAHDLFDDFKYSWSQLVLSSHDSHPNPLAHEIVAKRLAQLIGEVRPAYRAPSAQ
jgi:lysophospholipase L1-like esterase